MSCRIYGAAVTVILMGALSPIYAKQIQPTQWPTDVTTAEKTEILELAKRNGVENPRAVLYDLMGGPSRSCIALRVQSQFSVTGDRRTWTEFFVGTTDARKDYCPASAPRDITNAKWGIVEGLMTREEWRIHDGDWYLYVGLARGVTYDAATKIILALRRKTFVDRRDRSSSDLDVATILDGKYPIGINADFEIPSSQSGPDGKLVPVPPNPLGPDYTVMTLAGTAGYSIKVVLAGDQVLLLSTGMWMV